MKQVQTLPPAGWPQYCSQTQEYQRDIGFIKIATEGNNL